MNDRVYMREHVNRPLSNAVVVITVVIAALLALVSIPLEIFGSQ
jgi:hypothetical protein